jgi:N-acyl-D-aspartate/D-glutamate deacylase
LKLTIIQIGSTQHESILKYSGKRVAEVARIVNKPPIEVFFEVLRKDKLATGCLMHIGNEENVRMIMKHTKHMSGSDAILHGETLHPRAYGTFTKYIGETLAH